MYPSKWQASTDEHDKSGIATFNVEGREFVFRLEKFEDFQAISEMLELVEKENKLWGAEQMENTAKEAMSKWMKFLRCSGQF